MSKFKAGDKVYFPEMSNGILTLTETINSEYPLKVTLDNGEFRWFTTGGKRSCSGVNPPIFPATQEWYDKLVHVYPDLEKPPVKKSSQEIIQAMLNAGHKYVLCEVRRRDCQDSHEIDAIICTYRTFIGASGYLWYEATPITSKGQKIIDFIDGKCVLENGEVVLED